MLFPWMCEFLCGYSFQDDNPPPIVWDHVIVLSKLWFMDNTSFQELEHGNGKLSCADRIIKIIMLFEVMKCPTPVAQVLFLSHILRLRTDDRQGSIDLWEPSKIFPQFLSQAKRVILDSGHHKIHQKVIEKCHQWLMQKSPKYFLGIFIIGFMLVFEVMFILFFYLTLAW